MTDMTDMTDSDNKMFCDDINEGCIQDERTRL